MASSSDETHLPFLHRHHILLKSHYFIYCAALGALSPIINLTLRSHGLSNIEISFSNIILPFIVFLTSPLIGFIADRSRRFLWTFNILIILVVVSHSSLFFLPHIRSHHIQAHLQYEKSSKSMLNFCASQEVVTKCSSRSECGCSYHALCANTNSSFNFTFTINSFDVQKELNGSLKSLCGIDYRIPIEKDSLHNQLGDEKTSAVIKCEITCSIPYFCHGLRYQKQAILVALYSILYVISSNFLANTNTIGTSIGFASLPSPELFGTQRVWGTIGFGIFAFGTSRIYEFFRSEYVYIIIFDITCILSAVVTSFIPIRKVSTTGNAGKAKLDLSTLASLLKKGEVVVFLSITFVWGMCFGVINPYVYLYIDEIAPCQSRSIIGWMSLIAASSELVAFYLARKLIQLLGTNLTTIIIFLAFAVRFSGYYFIQKPYFFLPMETMHFFTFGILFILIAQRADAIAYLSAPAGLSGTLQGVAHGVMFGLGRGIGLLVSSFIYIVLQQRLLFLVFTIFNIIAAIIYSIYFLFTTKSRSSNQKSIPISDTDMKLHDEPLPSSPMMATSMVDNE